MVNDIDNEDKGISNNPMDVNNPNFIPPEQRSWNNWAVPLIWWVWNTPEML
jgi:hypothetical protein